MPSEEPIHAPIAQDLHLLPDFRPNIFIAGMKNGKPLLMFIHIIIQSKSSGTLCCPTASPLRQGER